MQGVGGQRGGVALGRDQPAERVADLVGGEAGGLDEGPALDELDDRAARGASRAAALGVEAGLGHALAVDPHGDAKEVAARGATGCAGWGPVAQCAEPARGVQVVLEAQGSARVVAAGTDLPPGGRCGTQWVRQLPRSARAATSGLAPVGGAAEVGLRATAGRVAGELPDVVAYVVGLHPQEIGVRAAVSLDDELGDGPVEVDARKSSTFCWQSGRGRSCVEPRLSGSSVLGGRLGRTARPSTDGRQTAARGAGGWPAREPGDAATCGTGPRGKAEGRFVVETVGHVGDRAGDRGHGDRRAASPAPISGSAARWTWMPRRRRPQPARLVTSTRALSPALMARATAAERWPSAAPAPQAMHRRRPADLIGWRAGGRARSPLVDAVQATGSKRLSQWRLGDAERRGAVGYVNSRSGPSRSGSPSPTSWQILLRWMQSARRAVSFRPAAKRSAPAGRRWLAPACR